MSKANGAVQPPLTETKEAEYHGQKLVEIVLDSGETVLVKALSVYLRRAIMSKAEELLPLPDKADYETPIDPEKTAIPGMVHPAEDNPDYRNRVAEILIERYEWYVEYLIGTLCIWPAGKDALIAKYADELAALSGVVDMPADDWEATWKYIIVSDQDQTNIVQAAQSNLMLTEGEVRDAMRIFRPVVSERTDPGTD